MIKIIKEKPRITKNIVTKNESNLTWLIRLIMISYIFALIIVVLVTYNTDSWLMLLLGILVLILAVITGVGFYMVRDNYFHDKKNPLITLGNTLISIGFNLMIGTIAIGSLSTIIISEIENQEQTIYPSLKNKEQIVEEHNEPLQQEGVNSDNSLFLPIITGLGGAVFGAVLTYSVTEKNNKNQFNRDNLMYLVDNVSEYLSILRKLNSYYSEYLKKDENLTDKDIKEVNGLVQEIEIYQKRIDVIVKNNKNLSSLYMIHCRVTNILRDYSEWLNGTEFVITGDGREKVINIIKEHDLIKEIGNYQEVLSDLINEHT